VESVRVVERRPVQTELDRQTICDFGQQWQAFQSNEGYYASQKLFDDILGPLLSPESLRALTTRLPHWALAALSSALQLLLWFYILACKVLPLPMRGYMLGVLGKLSAKNRALIIYDQLNPAYAKYYRGDEVRRLLEEGGFVNVRLYHRHGYSWTALADKPC